MSSTQEHSQQGRGKEEREHHPPPEEGCVGAETPGDKGLGASAEHGPEPPRESNPRSGADAGLANQLPHRQVEDEGGEDLGVHEAERGEGCRTGGGGGVGPFPSAVSQDQHPADHCSPDT